MKEIHLERHFRLTSHNQTKITGMKDGEGKMREGGPNEGAEGDWEISVSSPNHLEAKIMLLDWLDQIKMLAFMLMIYCLRRWMLQRIVV